MLSTSILYCNKLDDSLVIESIDSASSNHATPLKSSGQSVLGSLEPRAMSLLSEPSSNLSGSKFRFRVRYLGCNTCDPRSHRLDRGIAAYQKPLLDLYSAVLRRSVVLRSLYSSLSVVNQVADLSNHGIVIAERDRFSQPSKSTPHARPNSSVSVASAPTVASETVVTKVITPLSNILLWAAVKFQHQSRIKKVKNSAIKRRQIGVAFVPLSCSEAVLDKNAFVGLSLKQRFLLDLPHPPLFACVLQKVNSGQRLECHLFVCLTADDAIRMCNRMSELRQRSTGINRLQVPPPGQMGSYSYQSTPLQSSAASLISRTSNYAFSDLSSITPKLQFSEIGEEDSLPPQLDSIDSNTTSGIKSVAAYGRALPSPSTNGKLACDPRLFDKSRKIHKLQYRNPANAGPDSLSWTELSSIISIKSGSSKGNVPPHLAARDYRFQAFKGQAIGLSDLSQSDKLNCDNISNLSAAGKKSLVDSVAEEQGMSISNNKWSNVNNELLSNKLFAKASAKASCDFKNTPTPSHEFNNKQNISDNGLPSQFTFASNAPPTPTQRFFGDTLRLTTDSPIRQHTSELTNLQNSTSNETRINSDDLNSTNSELKQKEDKRFVKSNSRQNCKLESTISSSIFFDNEEASSESSKFSKRDAKSRHQIISHESTYFDNVSNNRAAQAKNANNKAKSESSVTTKSSQISRKSHKNRQRVSQKNDTPVVVYLPESSSVGVKCFNKSTSVEKWSTMVPSNPSNVIPPSECQFCSLELNCEECCNLCQCAIELQKPESSCPDCRLERDDILLDESILQNFRRQSVGYRDKDEETHVNALSNDRNLYHYQTPVANVPSAKNSSSHVLSKNRKSMSLFSRIRQLGSSIFSSRKNSNRPRTLQGPRTNHKKLKGSKRFVKSKTVCKETANRIFLPHSDNEGCRVYSESYLTVPSEFEPISDNAHSVSIPQSINTNGVSNESIKQLSEAVKHVNLNDRLNDSQLSQQMPTKDAKPIEASKVNALKRRPEFRLKESNSNEIYKRPECLKPFFVSHPDKVFHQNGIDGRKNDFGPNQVLSLSSDSGMEEYDCHSSTENSPSGYLQTTSPLAGKVENEKAKTKSKTSEAVCTPSEACQSQQPFTYQCTAQFEHLTSPPVPQTTNPHWQWSETNLQSELGYMP